MKFTTFAAMNRVTYKNYEFYICDYVSLFFYKYVKPIQNVFKRQNYLIKIRHFIDSIYA
jgi:hypothetical protein